MSPMGIVKMKERYIMAKRYESTNETEKLRMVFCAESTGAYGSRCDNCECGTVASNDEETPICGFYYRPLEFWKEVRQNYGE